MTNSLEVQLDTTQTRRSTNSSPVGCDNSNFRCGRWPLVINPIGMSPPPPCSG
jgi:hypothetical protein